VHYTTSLNEVDKHFDDILRLQEQPYSEIASGYRVLFASDGYTIHSGMGKDQALEFIEV
jgi:hypothetical protein